MGGGVYGQVKDMDDLRTHHTYIHTHLFLQFICPLFAVVH